MAVRCGARAAAYVVAGGTVVAVLAESSNYNVQPRSRPPRGASPADSRRRPYMWPVVVLLAAGGWLAGY